MAEVIYHVEGHTTCGWTSMVFEDEKKALAFFDSCEWQDGECVAEIFEPTRRLYKTLREV